MKAKKKVLVNCSLASLLPKNIWIVLTRPKLIGGTILNRNVKEIIRVILLMALALPTILISTSQEKVGPVLV